MKKNKKRSLTFARNMIMFILGKRAGSSETSCWPPGAMIRRLYFRLRRYRLGAVPQKTVIPPSWIVAQLGEHTAYTRGVAGSSPADPIAAQYSTNPLWSAEGARRS